MIKDGFKDEASIGREQGKRFSGTGGSLQATWVLGLSHSPDRRGKGRKQTHATASL
jgi:hypothetical protein